MAVNTIQYAWRIRIDANAAQGGSAAWGAAQNTTFFPGIAIPFRIRFSIENTGSTATTSDPFEIYCSRNAGAYAAVTTGGTYVKSVDATAGASSDNSNITSALLTGASGTLGTGQYDDTGATGSFSIAATHYCEMEFGLEFTTSAAATDTYAFRVYSNGVALTTYTSTPTITTPATNLFTSSQVRLDATAAQGGTPVWAEVQNTPNTNGAPVGFPFRIRFLVNNNGVGATASNAWQLYVNRNSGGFTAVTTSSTYVKAVDATAGASSNNSAITSALLSGGLGTFVNGVYNDTGATSAFALSNADYTEIEFAVEFTSSALTTDTYVFELYYNGAALNGGYSNVTQPSMAPYTVLNNSASGFVSYNGLDAAYAFLTTTGTNAVLRALVGILGNSPVPTVLSVSGGGVTWTQRYGSGSTTLAGSNYGDAEIWGATISAPLTNALIVIEFTSAPYPAEADVCVLAVPGGNITTPNDPNGSLPAVAVDTTGSAAVQVTGVSTSNANDYLYAMAVCNNYGAPGSGFTTINVANVVCTDNEYENLTTKQSGVTVTFDSGDQNGYGFIMVVDAIQMAAAANNFPLPSRRIVYRRTFT